MHKIETLMATESKRMEQSTTTTTPDDKKILILSIDGGGMRGTFNPNHQTLLGIITTCILERLVQKFPLLLDRVDVVTGTSNGGIVVFIW
jgi:patatin-like phospholipase/acyl hydrolase